MVKNQCFCHFSAQSCCTEGFQHKTSRSSMAATHHNGFSAFWPGLSSARGDDSLQKGRTMWFISWQKYARILITSWCTVPGSGWGWNTLTRSTAVLRARTRSFGFGSHPSWCTASSMLVRPDGKGKRTFSDEMPHGQTSHNHKQIQHVSNTSVQ